MTCHRRSCVWELLVVLVEVHAHPWGYDRILEWLRGGSACSDGTLYEVGLRFGAVLLVCASLSFAGQYLLTYFFITGECNRFW